MKILALESSALAASAALWADGRCVGLYLQNCGLTHSETLLPMAENLMKGTGVPLGDVDLIAVARGPGSFTGVRIGVATAKGLSWGLDKPCCGVSTLEAMAWQGAHWEGKLLCCCMDARRGQVYNALFRAEGAGLRRLSEDRAIALGELLPELTEAPVLLGDGAELTAKAMTEAGLPFLPAPEPLRIQSAWGVALAAANAPQEAWGEPEPVYLRLSQAERERLARLEKEQHHLLDRDKGE
jgi:tRNA threonylcarbamoyladenosine biosynthesis protein TsaB